MTEQPTDATLLPCPFCGGKAQELINFSARTSRQEYGCGNCNVACRSVAAWNTRAMQAAAPTPNGEGVDAVFERIAALAQPLTAQGEDRIWRPANEIWELATDFKGARAALEAVRAGDGR